MQTLVSNSEAETRRLAENLAKQIDHGVIALSGNLGAGKTSFVQGFAKGLGIKEKIISPTFVLMRQHQIPNTSRMLYHVDLYRLQDDKDFKEIGLDELINDPNNIVLIEWADKLKSLPQRAITITIKKKSVNKREFTIAF